MENTLNSDQTEPPPRPRKRLLTNPNANPKQTFTSESPESTVSFDSTSDRISKKTRELPNLSDCHSCGVRINYTNPRERLQPLDSMWRIVLLCKKCSKRVSSSDLCKYCFLTVVDKNDCFKCSDCKHSIHKDCVEKYGSKLGFFSVCVDCWVPEAIAKSIKFRNRKRKFRGKDKDKDNECFDILPESRVSVGEVNDIALNKPVVAKNAVELAKDDAELAFLLHRAINSSPRISRYACLVSSVRKDDAPIACYSRRRDSKKVDLMNSSGLDVPLICYSRRCRKGLLRNSASLNAALVCYSRRRSGIKGCEHDTECKASKKTDEHGSTSSAGLKACNPGSSSENCLSGNNCQENDVGGIGMKPPRYFFKYYRIGKGKQKPLVFVENSEVGSCMDSANLYTEDMPDTRNFGNGNGCHDISENCEDDTNRFLLKYKRSSRHKARI